MSLISNKMRKWYYCSILKMKSMTICFKKLASDADISGKFGPIRESGLFRLNL